MINIFSACIGSFIFLELITLVALLKPIREPYIIRDYWCKLQVNSCYPHNIILGFSIALLINSMLEIMWEKSYYSFTVDSVKNSELVWHFYSSKLSMCYTCFFLALYLLILIERIIQFLITIARLLEFELMCRHAILTKENGTTQIKLNRNLAITETL